jgi:hypothetical protein
MGGATSRAVGEFFAGVFAEDRQAIKVATERKLRQLDAGAVPSPSSTSLVSALESVPSRSVRSVTPTPTPSVGSSVMAHRPSLLSEASFALQTSPSAARRERAKQMAIAMVAAVVLVGGLAFVLLELRPPAAPTGTVASDPTAPAPPKRMTLTIQATPADATILLDDAILPSNPYVGGWPMDGVTHRVRVEAPGYVTRTHWVPFDEPSVTLKVSLTKNP